MKKKKRVDVKSIFLGLVIVLLIICLVLGIIFLVNTIRDTNEITSVNSDAEAVGYVTLEIVNPDDVRGDESGEKEKI